jgi:hypothetical protein
MNWPIPVFTKIEYPEPISLRKWIPILVIIASGAAGGVLLLWPHGTPTNTVLFWASVTGAPVVACALAFGFRLDQWEDDQVDAEECEREQERLRGMWGEWTRRDLSVVDVAAFLADATEIAKFASVAADLPVNSGRSLAFKWAKGRTIDVRRTRLFHLIVRRFADSLRARGEVIITLMLADTSPKDARVWVQQARRVFSYTCPGTTLHVEVQSARDSVQWITEQADQVGPATRLVIAPQLWSDEDESRKFSEGAAAFLIDSGASNTGSIFRPMTTTREVLESGLAQVKDYQTPANRLTRAWFTHCTEGESTAVRSALTPDPKEPADECLLDKSLGLPGPASGWIALAIAMEAMRGAGPQLVVWREPGSESLHLCTVAPLPRKETTV